ncbi:hypothetical protein GCM10009133_09560 [Cocleimonas flava]|uniref:DUF1328 domain-containing protein n=1 Tax=Cocleimonas TaxID=998014 RepID=UPI001047CF40|nr:MULTISPECIES: DUF1328 domain-containing protein [Cocleimonas]MEB8431818.1 hypothetical protein [Cocleimonas sp. KMM 6892]MEC4715096.1 hypothetical protein [Cocleimonas sp. KMM 6895]MEC4744090.1 hypothetical protein [Cocleimonas sp. KMM 6896]
MKYYSITYAVLAVAFGLLGFFFLEGGSMQSIFKTLGIIFTIIAVIGLAMEHYFSDKNDSDK